MVVVYRFLSRNRPVLLFPHRSDLYRYSDSRQPEPYLSCNELRYLVVISSLPIICRVIRCSSSSEVILSAISLTAAPASPAMPAFAPISSNCSATLVLQVLRPHSLWQPDSAHYSQQRSSRHQLQQPRKHIATGNAAGHTR